MYRQQQQQSPFQNIWGQLFPGSFGQFTPGGPPSTPPPGGGPGVPGGGGAPTSPPPSFTPSAPPGQAQGQVGVYAVDPGGIRGCLFKFTYVWLSNRQSFWYYPVYVGRYSVAGYRWIGWRWVYYGIDTRLINAYQCY